MESRSNRAVAAALFLAAGFAQTPAPSEAVEPKPASIEGEVRNSVTQAPVERVHVVLRRWNGGMRERYGAYTGPEGRFLIGNLSPGDYTVSLERTGYG